MKPMDAPIQRLSNTRQTVRAKSGNLTPRVGISPWRGVQVEALHGDLTVVIIIVITERPGGKL